MTFALALPVIGGGLAVIVGFLVWVMNNSMSSDEEEYY